MKRILLVLVGGTICTESNDNILSVSENAGVKIKNNYLHSDSVFAADTDIELTKNLMILSENMSVGNWIKMKNAYCEAISASQYDGVIFAHGTDSLAYSAALFSVLLCRTEIPVFFVSSNENLDSPRANGNDNFKYAVECICYGIEPNVYVTYRNISDGQMYLHLASRLRQCANYSEDFFSDGAVNITDDPEAACKLVGRLYPAKKGTAPLGDIKEVRLSDCVLNIQPYVGINYDAYSYDKFKAVLHGTYHSGTACAGISPDCLEYGSNSILHMIDLCAEQNVDCYLAPSKNEGTLYDSADYIAGHEKNGRKISFLYGTTNEMIYVKLLLAYSNFTSAADIDTFLHTEYNYEFIAQ